MVNSDNLRFYGEPQDIFAPNKPLVLRAISFEKDGKGLTEMVTLENAELFKGGYYYTVKTKYIFYNDKIIPKSVEFTERV